MTRAIHVFRTPDRFVAGTVGQPGNRTFYIQAVHDTRVVSVSLEKQQVAMLAERIGALLVEINRRFGTPLPSETEVEDLDPLITPVDAEFRVGTMGLGWDAEAQSVVVELLAVSDTEYDASVILDDSEDGPDAVRVFLSPDSARQFAHRARSAMSHWTRRATSVSAPTAISAADFPLPRKIPTRDGNRRASRDAAQRRVEGYGPYPIGQQRHIPL